MDSEPKHVFWQRHIDGWLQSQMPQQKYCDQHDLSMARFGYWRTRLKRIVQPTKKLVPVNVARPSASVGIFLPGGIRLEVTVYELAAVLPVVYQSLRDLS